MGRSNKMWVRITAEVELLWDEEAATGGNPDRFIATVVKSLKETLASHPALLARAQELIAKNSLKGRLEVEDNGSDRELDALWKGLFEALPTDVSGQFGSLEHFWESMMLLDLLQGKVKDLRVEPLG